LRTSPLGRLVNLHRSSPKNLDGQGRLLGLFEMVEHRQATKGRTAARMVRDAALRSFREVEVQRHDPKA